MREANIEKIGYVLRVLQAHRLRRLTAPKNNIRVTYTHHVFKDHLDSFEAAIKYFKSNRKIITPREFFAFYEHGFRQGRHLLITFDDGLLSSYYAAKKVLSKYQIKAAFFIPTAILEHSSDDIMKDFALKHIYFGKRKYADLRPEEYVTMGKEHIRELQEDGHMILPHTHTHRNLNSIYDKEEAKNEILMPKMILEDFLRCKINAFAFPVGTERDVSSYAYSFIKKEYRFCFSGLAGLNTPATNRYFIHRDCFHPHYNLYHLRNVLDGVYDFFYLYKMARLKNAALKADK